MATVVGIWSELKTAQVETWAERVYDTFLLLDGVGKFELSDQLKELSKTATGNDDVEGGGEAEADADADAEDVAAGGGGEDAVLTESDDDSVAGPRNHAVDVWKFMMSDPAVRDATSSSGSDVASSLLVVPWEAVRNHAFVTSVADADVDVVDILAELYDKDGRGVHRDDFVALCGLFVCVCVVNVLVCLCMWDRPWVCSAYVDISCPAAVFNDNNSRKNWCQCYCCRCHCRRCRDSPFISLRIVVHFVARLDGSQGRGAFCERVLVVGVAPPFCFKVGRRWAGSPTLHVHTVGRRNRFFRCPSSR